MIQLIARFQRQYHKARKVAGLLTESDAVSFRIDIENELLSAKTVMPDNDETLTRFVVLMRPFLDKDNQLFLRHIWGNLTAQFANDIPIELAKGIDESIMQLNIGFMKLNVDHEEISHEQMYSMISDGEFFAVEDDAKQRRSDLIKNPIIGPLFLQQFYSYSMSAFNVVSLVFEAIKHVKKSEKYTRMQSATMQRDQCCIYCLRTTPDTTFKSEEHVYPEALGNEDMILPRGVVCDTCNNTILSQLDQYLVDFEPVAFLRVQYLSHTKQGKLPVANFQNAKMYKTKPREIRIEAKDKTGMPKNIRDAGDSRISWTQTIRGKRVDMLRLGRALCKIALGTVALELGSEKAISDCYDEARQFILGNQDFSNNLLIKMMAVPHPQVSITFYDLDIGTPFLIDLMGIVFMFNIETEPTIQMNDELRGHKFQTFSLRNE